MLAGQRQSHILQRVRETGAVRVSDLTRALDVSDMTIRRDLDFLARQGLVTKVHGGATTPGHTSTEEPGFEIKSTRQLAEKDAIARLAAEQVQPGLAIGLSAGTTTFRLARLLVHVPNITVVTNSVQIAGVFYQSPRPDQTVVLTGGVRTPSDALVGPVAVQTLRSLHLDLVFLGVHGMDPETGFTCPNLLEAETARVLAHSARRLTVVADHTQWGVVGISTVASLSDAETVVTDDGMQDSAVAALAEQVGEVLVARVLPAASDAEGP